MWYVVWQLYRWQDPRAILAIFGAVASFETQAEAKAFARKGHPMHKGWYRVVEGGSR